jgi:redox-sensitive bicupin YhaK (pirin superfamily)
MVNIKIIKFIQDGKYSYIKQIQEDADHGWLQANFSFSFVVGTTDRIQFGALRVLNDDVIGEGMGFGTHPHDNMEITIPLEGDLAHKDSREMQPQSKMVMYRSGMQEQEYNTVNLT